MKKAFIYLNLLLFNGIAFADPVASILTFDDLMSSYSRSHALGGFEGKAKVRASAQTESATRRFGSPLRIGGESEIGNLGGEERSVTMLVKKNITAGINDAEIAKRFEEEFQADRTALLVRRQEKKIEIAKLFAKLRHFQDASKVTTESLTNLHDLLEQARRAVKRGALSALTVKRWENSLSTVDAQAKRFVTLAKTMSTALTKVTGLAFMYAPNLTIAEPQLEKTVSFEPEKSLSILSKRARQRSLAARAESLGQFEIDTGLGYRYDFATKQGALLLQAEIPIGAKSAASSEAREYLAERDVIDEEANLEAKSLAAGREILFAEIETQTQLWQASNENIKRLESLLVENRKAFERAQADLGDLFEIQKEILDEKLRRAEVSEQRDAAVGTLKILSSEAE